jgi:hypothetical protein
VIRVTYRLRGESPTIAEVESITWHDRHLRLSLTRRYHDDVIWGERHVLVPYDRLASPVEVSEIAESGGTRPELKPR